MKRITDKDLKAVVHSINLITGSPIEPYGAADKKGGYTPSNIGHYHLDFAYGGVRLDRFMNTGGGINTVIFSGYTTKRELYNLMQAFVRGLEQKLI